MTDLKNTTEKQAIANSFPAEKKRPHALALIFPAQTTAEYDAMKDSIEAHGLYNPVVIYDGQILDGRHRYRACRELGIEPRYDELPSDIDPLHYVIAQNVQRRKLTSSQRAMLAAGVAIGQWGGDRKSAEYKKQRDNCPFDSLTNEDAAGMFGISSKSVKRARKVRDRCIPEIVALVESGQIKVYDAMEMSDHKHSVQQEILSVYLNPEIPGTPTLQRAWNRMIRDKETKYAAEREGRSDEYYVPVPPLVDASPPPSATVVDSSSIDDESLLSADRGQLSIQHQAERQPHKGAEIKPAHEPYTIEDSLADLAAHEAAEAELFADQQELRNGNDTVSNTPVESSASMDADYVGHVPGEYVIRSNGKVIATGSNGSSAPTLAAQPLATERKTSLPQIILHAYLCTGYDQRREQYTLGQLLDVYHVYGGSAGMESIETLEEIVRWLRRQGKACDEEAMPALPSQ